MSEQGRCPDLTKYPKGWLRCPLPEGHAGVHVIDFDNPGTPAMSEHQLDGTKKPAALLHVETDVDVVLDALARWHGEQDHESHPGGFDLCPASPCRDVREAL